MVYRIGCTGACTPWATLNSFVTHEDWRIARAKRFIGRGIAQYRKD